MTSPPTRASTRQDRRTRIGWTDRRAPLALASSDRRSGSLLTPRARVCASRVARAGAPASFSDDAGAGRSLVLEVDGMRVHAFVAPWRVAMVLLVSSVARADEPALTRARVSQLQVQINTPVKALSPVEVERRITFPIEWSMGGIPRVEHVRSLSRYGLSQVTVVFEDGTDIYWARQLVGERLAAAKESLPRDIDVVGADVSGESWGFQVGDNGASKVGDFMWFGPMKRFQKIFFHTPLVNAFIFGSEAYHDYYRWPLKDKKTFEGWKRDTSWGRLFEAYERGEAERIVGSTNNKASDAARLT
jgi:hypothetical protein